MIDFHSHILPGIDDGSRRVEDSVEMLCRLRSQGVDTVVLTPHFYANEQSVAHFLERRQDAMDRLLPHLPADCPRLLLGAEVLYYRGISRNEALPHLCMEETDTLLLEMPFARWGEYEVREVCELACSSGLTVVMAHIERYMALQNRKTWDRLLDCGAWMQCNAEFFLAPLLRRKALHMMRQGWIHLLGTDTHNLTTRAPHMDAAVSLIQRRLGNDFFEDWNRRCYDLLASWNWQHQHTDVYF